MVSFEIKIFANPTGYGELKLNNKSNLFTEELVRIRNFDGDGDSFRDGAFSIFYTPEVYVITFHFDVAAEAGFRAPRVHFAVAIRRGFKMETPVDVFNELKIEFNKFAAVQRASGIRNIYDKVTDFEKIIEPHIRRDIDQLRINAKQPNDLSRAVVVYDKAEQLACLLEEPMRPEFKLDTDTGILVILQREDATLSWPLLQGAAYKKLSLSEYKFVRKYELVFPDGYAYTINSYNEEIDYTCKKPYFESCHFKGNILEHYEDWNISRNADNTQFIIGVQLAPEVKKWQLLLINSSGERVTSKSIPLKASLGVIEGNTLILTGDEIGEINNLLFTSSAPQWSVVGRTRFSAEEVEIEIKQMIPYDLTQAFLYVKKKYDFSPVFFLYNKDREEPLAKFDKSNLQQYIDLPYSKAFLQIAESEKFAVYNLFFNSDGSLSPFSLEKKSMFSLNFNIVDEKVKQRMGKGEDLNCRYTVNNKLGEKKITLDDCKISELPEAACVEFRLKFPGYKAYEDKVVISKKLKTVDVYFRQATSAIAWKIFKAVWLYVLVLGCGIGIGWTTNRGMLANQPISDSDTITILNDTIRNLRLKNDQLRDSITKYNKCLEEEKQQYKELRDSLNHVTSKSPQKTAISDKIKKLVKKLKGNEYTWDDITTLKRKNINEYKQLIKEAELCISVGQSANEEKKTKDKFDNLIKQLENVEEEPHITFREVLKKYKNEFMSTTIKGKPECNTLESIIKELKNQRQ